MTTFSRITSRLNAFEFTPAQRLQYGLIALWMLAMISLPIFKWTFGEEIIPTAVTFALMVQFVAVLTIVSTHAGLRWTLVALAIVAVTTWSLEEIGSHTGFPFGGYSYTDVLQPQIGGVPLLIPLAWFMMLPSSWAVASAILGERRHRVYGPAAYIGISALAITAWDLFLDPQMVDWGFWVWENPTGYFGIPWVNYAGWILTGVLVTWFVRPYRRTLPIIPLLTVYGVVWFLQSIGQAVFWGQPGPAFVGSIAMGILLVLAGWRLNQETSA